MNGNEFLKKLKAYGKKHGIKPFFDETQGKGSHGTLYFGTGRTTLKDRKKEIGEGLLRSMLDDLGINRKDF